jgi:hypothetical protein
LEYSAGPFSGPHRCVDCGHFIETMTQSWLARGASTVFTRQPTDEHQDDHFSDHFIQRAKQRCRWRTAGVDSVPVRGLCPWPMPVAIARQPHSPHRGRAPNRHHICTDQPTDRSNRSSIGSSRRTILSIQQQHQLCWFKIGSWDDEGPMGWIGLAEGTELKAAFAGHFCANPTKQRGPSFRHISSFVVAFRSQSPRVVVVF